MIINQLPAEVKREIIHRFCVDRASKAGHVRTEKKRLAAIERGKKRRAKNRIKKAMAEQAAIEREKLDPPAPVEPEGITNDMLWGKSQEQGEK